MIDLKKINLFERFFGLDHPCMIYKYMCSGRIVSYFWQKGFAKAKYFA